jgi:hypothetical protein
MSRATRTFALLVPFAMIAALIGGIQPAVAQVRCAVPDAQIRGGPADLTYMGDNIYSNDGLGQTLQRQVRPRFGDQFNIKIQNDADCLDSFLVRGGGSTMRFNITYWHGALNVTSDVVAGTFKTIDLKAGESDFLKVFIYAKRGTRSGSWIKDLVYVTSSSSIPLDRGAIPSGVLDVVGARVLVNRHAGDFNSQLPTP